MSVKLNTGLDNNNQRIIQVADPTNPTDGATKQYVDNFVGGLSFKNEVRVGTTASGTLASAYANGSTIDGITLATGDRILIKDQSSGAENGIYTVNASGAPTRAIDADTTADLNNATVFITDGTVNGGRIYTQTVKNPTVGTTALVWAQFATGVTYTAGNGISLPGNAITVVPKSGGGIVVDGTGVSIDPAYAGLGKRYAIDVPSGSATPAITHGLGTKDVHVTIFEISSGVEVLCDVTHTSTSVVTLGFASAPSTGQYRCVVTG